MTISPALLTALSAPTVAALSDADAAAALSTPTYAAITTPVTITTLGAAWGAPRAAAVYAQLKAIAASASPSAALCSMVVDVLAGPGFNAGNAQSIATIAQLVAAGICTQAEADAATGTPIYPAGVPVTTADVTAARAVLPAYQQLQLLLTQGQQFYGWAQNEILVPQITALLAGQTVTPPATLEALLSSWRALT